MSVPYVGF